MATRWNSCNVLRSGPDSRQLWQFGVRKGTFALEREHSLNLDQSPPASVVIKTISSFWQPKLNVAWLPAESVFLRVVQLPKATAAETVSMVELQLEKLSPIPVTQMVWSLQLLPQEAEELQTLIVVFAERKAVEEFLGQLETQGFLADRLELPALDQMLATPPTGDGAWIYPGAWAGSNSALVAWWSGGVLRTITFISMPETGDRAAAFKSQLAQMTWAGEMEGWLTTRPAWHLVANEATAGLWEPPLREGLDEPIAVSAPLPPAELAALTAKRAAHPQNKTNLLPPEFLKRYQQQFVDRLWIRALAAVGVVYIACVLVYFAVLAVLNYQTTSAEKNVKQLSLTYTNAIQLKAKLEVLNERHELKYAALDCWKAVAEIMPETLTLDGFNFTDGKRLTLNGTAPKDDANKALDFNSELRKVSVGGQPLFSATGGQDMNWRGNPGNATASWNFALDLKRVVAQ